MSFTFNPFTGTLDIRVTSSSGIGDAVTGADPDRVLFTDASGNLAQSLDLFYSDSARSFSIGGGTPDIGMVFGGTIQHTDGTTLVFNSGINVGEFIVNGGFADNVYFRVGANTSGYLMATDPLNEWVQFGTNSDMGGFVGMKAINTLDDTLRIRAIVGQSGHLTSWQATGLNQILGVNVNGELECGSTSQGVKISGATTGILTLTGYGNANNESLSLNFESVANTVGVTSSTGVTAITFSGFALSSSSYTGSVIMTDNVGLSMGSGTDARLEFDTSEGNDTLKLGLVCGSVNSSGYFLICESADINTNFGVGTPTDPHLRIQSSDATQTSDYIEFWHDQTDANIGVGNGNLKINKTIDISAIGAGTTNFIITATSDTPTVTWGAAAGNEASAAPAGYLEITVGGNARYIPFWS